MDPVIGEDGVTVDLTFALDFDYGPPTESRNEKGAPGKKSPLETPQPIYHRMHLNQSLSTLTGQWRMIGMWQPDGKGKDVMQAAFICVDVVKGSPKQP